MIPVTKPFLPPQEAYMALLNGVWERNWLTNNGPLVNELEAQLKAYLGTPHLLYLNNGTIAIQIAIKALGVQGEVITTPFSYVATSSSLVWEGCTPVFVDIDPGTFNIDPSKMEEAITDRTTAILATHCFGNACDIDAIEAIAQRHGLKVIYDAAHCFGTLYKGRSVFAYGDVSTTSLHATKLFHTVEGGAVFTQDPEVLKTMAYMRNFGHNGPERFFGVGINGKNSEFHAAMGLVNLAYIGDILDMRRELCSYYREALAGLPLRFQQAQQHCQPNYSYFPVVLKDEQQLLAVRQALEAKQVYPRRYFYPPLSDLPYVMPNGNSLPVTQDISPSILCLPLYHSLSKAEIDFIASILHAAL
jgi:dTDP-4-amino-4,6-dideoxygalactose transaminase